MTSIHQVCFANDFQPSELSDFVVLVTVGQTGVESGYQGRLATFSLQANASVLNLGQRDWANTLQ